MTISKTKKEKFWNEQKTCKDFVRGYGNRCKFSKPWGPLFECKKIEPLLCPYAMYIKEK